MRRLIVLPRSNGSVSHPRAPRRHPDRFFPHEGDHVVIATGAEARSGRDHGPAITRVRTEDGRELPGTEHFTSMGGRPTGRP